MPKRIKLSRNTMSRKDNIQTLEDIYREKVSLIVNAEVELNDDDWECALDLEEKLKLGLELTAQDLECVNQTIEKYELE